MCLDNPHLNDVNLQTPYGQTISDYLRYNTIYNHLFKGFFTPDDKPTPPKLDEAHDRLFNLDDFKFDTTSNNNNNPDNNDGICNDNENCLTFTCKDGNCINPQIDIDPNNNNNGDDDNDNSASSPFIDSLKCKDKEESLPTGYVHSNGGNDLLNEFQGCSDIPMSCLLENNGLLDGNSEGCDLKGGWRFSSDKPAYYYICDDACNSNYNDPICYTDLNAFESLFDKLNLNSKLCRGNEDNGVEFNIEGINYPDNTPIRFKCSDCTLNYYPINLGDISLGSNPIFSEITVGNYDELDCPFTIDELESNFIYFLEYKTCLELLKSI